MTSVLKIKTISLYGETRYAYIKVESPSWLKRILLRLCGIRVDSSPESEAHGVEEGSEIDCDYLSSTLVKIKRSRP